MLNFRYHVVSLVAVFLALAIGVIMGTTVLDRAIVDRLEDQQAALRADIDEARATNATLQGELDRRRAELAQLGERAVAGALDGVPTLVLGVRGAEPEGWEELLDRLADAGAASRRELWLTSRFALESDDDVAALAEALGASTGTEPGVLRATAVERLAAELRVQAEAPPEGDVADDQAPTVEPVIGPLVDAGFLERPGDLDDGEGLAEPGSAAVVFADGADGVVEPEVLTTLAGELATDEGPGAAVPVVVAEHLATGEGLELSDEVVDAAVVPVVRGDDDLRGRVATVDHLGDATGRVATVLALADAVDGRTGHYGAGPEAARLVPPPAGEG